MLYIYIFQAAFAHFLYYVWEVMTISSSNSCKKLLVSKWMVSITGHIQSLVASTAVSFRIYKINLRVNADYVIRVQNERMPFSPRIYLRNEVYVKIKSKS